LAVAFVFGEFREQIATWITLYGREVFDEKSMAPFYISNIEKELQKVTIR